MHDLLIRGGLVVDGSGLPGKYADVAINEGRVTEVGRPETTAARQTIDAEGMVVAPGIVDIHTHYDPQVTWDPMCDTSALHGVTSVAAGNCGFSVAPCRPEDHGYVAQVFARVEGMDQQALGHIDWSFETFEEFLASRRGKLGVNLGMYVGHSAIRRWVMGEDAHQREASQDEVAAMADLVDSAMRAGALGFSSSQAPTHLDLADRPVPSRLASKEEIRSLADAVGRHGRGSIAHAPESAVEGISGADRDFLIELSRRAGVPVVTQGLGGRSKVDAPTQAWEASREFLDRSAAQGTPVYSLLMTRAFNGPFTLEGGSSRYDGVPLWREMMALTPAERAAWIRSDDKRAELRAAIDSPNTDPSKGSTLPPPMWQVLRLIETGHPASEKYIGRGLADIADELGTHPADVMFDLALADDLRAVFHWSNETPEWRRLLRDVQRHPQMVVGVSDGGAHLDFDDGAEWSTHFLVTWWREDRLWRLEEAIRRITALPAAVCGLVDRGLLQVGRPADVFVFDPEGLDLGIRRMETDAVTGAPRFRSVPKGVRATVVNGAVVVADGERTGALPGEVIRPA
jgi:N-acyl-D-aspartate/D-glutamate deacylase